MISKNRLKYIRSLEMKKFRKQEGVFVAEGPKVIDDLKDYFELVEMWEGEDADKASFLETPQHKLAIFKQRQENMDANLPDTTLCLALDDVQNPGNFGTIIRIADWFGIHHIYCSEECADVYNPKVVQATMGSLARVHIHYCNLAKFIDGLDKNTPVYGTFLDGDIIYNKELKQRGLIIMGNEGHGVSDEIAALVTERLYIPNYPQDSISGESLNVAIATAIVCNEFRRR